MRISISIALLICFISSSCQSKKEVQRWKLCPCDRIKFCSFYSKMENYLYKKGLLNDRKDAYYKLIKDIKQRKVLINSIDIWDESIDPDVAFLVDYDQVVHCFDSLYSNNPNGYSDSKEIIYDFLLKSLDKPIDDSVLHRASLNIDLNEGNHFALQQFLWTTILDVEAIRLNEEYK
jgi:hypothetical protein